MLPLTVVASRSASSRSGSSTVAEPLTVTTFTSPVSPNACIAACTEPFTEIACTGPFAVRASTPPLTDTATMGADAPATCTEPFTVVAPRATPFGRRTTNSTATSFPLTDVGFHSAPGTQPAGASPQSAQTVRPAPERFAITLTVLGSRGPEP